MPGSTNLPSLQQQQPLVTAWLDDSFLQKFFNFVISSKLLTGFTVVISKRAQFCLARPQQRRNHHSDSRVEFNIVDFCNSDLGRCTCEYGSTPKDQTSVLGRGTHFPLTIEKAFHWYRAGKHLQPFL